MPTSSARLSARSPHASADLKPSSILRTSPSYFGGLRRTFLGLDSRNASIESRLLIDTFYGIQVGLVINDDDDRATEAFDRALQQHHERITALSGQPA